MHESRLILSALAFFLSLSLCHLPLQAASPPDSLGKVLETASPAEQAKLLHTLVRKNMRRAPDKSLDYARRAYELTALSDDSLTFANACNNLGMCYVAFGKFDSAKVYHFKALGIRQRYSSDKEVAASLNNLGIVAKREGDYPQAIRYHTESLALKAACGDSVGMSRSLNNIGLVYQLTGRMQVGLEKALAALRIKEALRDSAGLTATLNNVGLIFLELGNGKEALKHFRGSLACSERYGSRRQDAMIFNNIGLTYLSMDSLVQARKYFDKSLRIRRKAADRIGIAATLSSLANLLAREGRYNAALFRYNESQRTLGNTGPRGLREEICLELARTHLAMDHPEKTVVTLKSGCVDLGANFNSSNAHRATALLAKAYRAMGAFDSAYHYLQAYTSNQDSLDREKTGELVADIFLQYTNEKQEQEINALREANSLERLEKRRVTQVRNLLIGGIILILLVLSGFVWQFRLRASAHRDLAQRNAAIKAQNEALEMANSELDRARRAAEAASTSKSIFLANMSHEVRTPLNGIMGVTAILRDTPLNSEQEKYADTIYSSSVSLLDILNDILDFSKIEAGKLTIEAEPLDLKGLLLEVETLMRTLSDAKGLTLEVDIASNVPPALLGDVTRLRQIVVNLVNNAIKFTDFGRIRVRCERELGEGIPEGIARIHLVVSDTGKGIPQEKLPYIFDSFRQVEEGQARIQGGVGLGLAICKSLVDMMNGKIVVESESGKGATFNVQIDLPVGDVKDLKRKQEKVRSLTAFDKRLSEEYPLTILAVDDNEVNQMIVERMLLNWGYHPDLAGNGAEVLRMVQKKHYDLILMDIQMPGMDGVEATRAIREDFDLAVQPVVVAITANAMSDQKDEYLKAGMDDYLGKPFRVEQMADLLRKWGKRKLNKK